MINVNLDQLCEVCKADPRKRPSECSEECNKKHKKKNTHFICQYCGEIGYSNKMRKFHQSCFGEYRSEKYSGPNSPNWEGGRFLHSDGYWRVYCRDHPRADTRHYVLEHILIMEEKMSRYLKNDESVHHENLIKTDNRIENMRLMLKIDHDRIHCEGRMIEYRVTNFQCESKNPQIMSDVIFFPQDEYEPNYFPSARMF